MAKYEKDDCRNSADLCGAVSDYPKIYLEIPVRRSRNRHQKRVQKRFFARKNTRGFPVGFNAKTWRRNKKAEK